MDRIKLSNSQIITKIAIIIFAICFVAVSFNPFNLGGLIFGIFAEGYLCYIAFFAGDKIEFDKDHMYIVYKDGETEVDLKNIFYIARTSVSVGGLGKIKYFYDGSEYYAQFYPRYFSRAYRLFTNEVLNKNPDAVVYRLWGV